MKGLTLEDLIETEIDHNPDLFYSWLYKTYAEGNNQVLWAYAKTIKPLGDWEVELEEQIEADAIDRRIKQSIEGV